MRPAEPPGRLLERHGNVPPRGMTAPSVRIGATEPGLSTDFPFSLFWNLPFRGRAPRNPLPLPRFLAPLAPHAASFRAFRTLARLSASAIFRQRGLTGFSFLSTVERSGGKGVKVG